MIRRYWSSSFSSLVLENTSTNSRTSRRRKDEDEQRHCPVSRELGEVK
jgi:hypothetical protein